MSLRKNRLLWSLKIRCRFRKIPPLDPALRQINPVNVLTLILKDILILFFSLRLDVPSGIFSSCFPTKIFYEFIIRLIYAMCPIHLVLLDLITLIILDEENKL
jgi:hypothetical protein